MREMEIKLLHSLSETLGVEERTGLGVKAKALADELQSYIFDLNKLYKLEQTTENNRDKSSEA